MNAYDPALPLSQQDERCALILDNARVHDQAAIARIQAAGVLVRLLPPYIPDFNPVEDEFSVWSIWQRRHVTPEQFNEWPFLALRSCYPLSRRTCAAALSRPRYGTTHCTSNRL